MLNSIFKKILLSATIVLVALLFIILLQILGLLSNKNYDDGLIVYAFFSAFLICSFYLFLLGEIISLIKIIKIHFLFRKNIFIMLFLFLFLLRIVAILVNDKIQIVIIMYIALILLTTIGLIVYCKFRPK